MKHIETDHKPYAAELENIKAQLVRVQKPFLDTLANIVSSNKGWETKEGKKLFTGATWCVLAAYALHDALNTNLHPSLSLHVWKLDIFFNKEYVGGAGAFYRELFGSHAIFQIADFSMSASLFVDPTYGQVSFPYAGKFLFFEPYELGMFYQTAKENSWGMHPIKRPINSVDLTDITREKEIQMKYMEKEKGITKSNYRLLVQSLTGGRV